MPPRRHTHARSHPRAATVRACRAYAYLSIEELAGLLDVSRSTVTRWEAGEWLPSDDQMQAIGTVCDLTAWRMMLDGRDDLASQADELIRQAQELRDALGAGDLRIVNASEDGQTGLQDDVPGW